MFANMNFIIDPNTIFAIEVLVILLVGLSEVVKRATGLAKKFIPLLNIGLGIGLAFVVFWSLGWDKCLLTGVIIGLQASGLFSGVKNVYQGASNIFKKS